MDLPKWEYRSAKKYEPSEYKQIKNAIDIVIGFFDMNSTKESQADSNKKNVSTKADDVTIRKSTPEIDLHLSKDDKETMIRLIFEQCLVKIQEAFFEFIEIFF